MDRNELINFYKRMFGEDFKSFDLSNSSLPLKFIENYAKNNYIDIESLCKNKNVTVNFLEKLNIPYEYKYMFSNRNTPFSFIKKHFNGEYLELICKNSNVHTEFFEENIQKLNTVCWENLCENTNIRIEFFENNINKLTPKCWQNLCKNKNIRPEFIEKNLNKLNNECWTNLLKNKNISSKFILKNECYFYLKSTHKLNKEIFLRNNKNIYDLNLGDIKSDVEMWLLIHNKHLDEKNFEMIFDKLFIIANSRGEMLRFDYNTLSEINFNENLFSFEIENMNRIKLSENKSIPFYFFERNKKLFNSESNLVKNNFNKFFMKQDRIIFHEKFVKVLKDIYSLAFLPENQNKFFPKGGHEYSEMIKNY